MHSLRLVATRQHKYFPSTCLHQGKEISIRGFEASLQNNQAHWLCHVLVLFLRKQPVANRVQTGEQRAAQPIKFRAVVTANAWLSQQMSE